MLKQCNNSTKLHNKMKIHSNRRINSIPMLWTLLCNSDPISSGPSMIRCLNDKTFSRPLRIIPRLASTLVFARCKRRKEQLGQHQEWSAVDILSMKCSTKLLSHRMSLRKNLPKSRNLDRIKSFKKKVQVSHEFWTMKKTWWKVSSTKWNERFTQVLDTTLFLNAS
jgi:hypothetical protein